VLAGGAEDAGPGEPATGPEPTLVAAVADGRTFRFDDVFCAAPLAVYRNELYAGGQRDGSLYRLAAAPVAAAATASGAPGPPGGRGR
jgi:hypothetical protein